MLQDARDAFFILRKQFCEREEGEEHRLQAVRLASSEGACSCDTAAGICAQQKDSDSYRWSRSVPPRADLKGLPRRHPLYMIRIGVVGCAVPWTCNDELFLSFVLLLSTGPEHLTGSEPNASLPGPQCLQKHCHHSRCTRNDNSTRRAEDIRQQLST